MEGAVFTYFVAIGSGLALGIAIVTIPALMIFKKMNNRPAKVKGGVDRGTVQL